MATSASSSSCVNRRSSGLSTYSAAEQLASRGHRHRKLTARVGEPRKRNRRLELRTEPGAFGAFSERAAVSVFRRHVRDADRRPLLRRDADDPTPKRHLGSDARLRIAAARHREQTPAARVEHQQHRVLHAEVRVEPLEHVVEQRYQTVAVRNRIRERSHRAQPIEGGRGSPARAGMNALDVQHPVDVGPAQSEHAGHPRVRRDAGQPRFHALEDRPRRLGAAVPRDRGDSAIPTSG